MRCHSSLDDAKIVFLELLSAVLIMYSRLLEYVLFLIISIIISYNDVDGFMEHREVYRLLFQTAQIILVNQSYGVKYCKCM